MIPRVEMKARELLQKGERISAVDLASMAFCHEATARRALNIIHAKKGCRIVWWRRSSKHWIPVYGLDAKKRDIPKPDPLTVNERVRKYLSNPEKHQKAIERKRAARRAAKEKRNEEIRSDNGTENIFSA